MKTTTAAVAVAAALIGSSPAAHADMRNADAFLQHVRALGFRGEIGDGVLIAQGYRECEAVEHGKTVAFLIAQAEANLIPKGYTKADADGFVAYAIGDLCSDAI